MKGLDSVFPLPSGATADLIADVLRAQILDGELESGAHVNEVHVAERFDVSRGPVRQAVQRLVQEGLLTHARNRGTRVVELDLADVADVYQVRAAIEREAALALLGDVPDTLPEQLDEVLDEMSQAVEQDSWSAISLADVRFHQTIVNAAQSPRLSRVFSTLVAESLLCIRRLEIAYQSRGRLVEQHRKLADLMTAGDSDAYLAELDWHLRNSVITISNSLDGS
ncbi:GntR family transcriptional regulator [Nocardioidaceae bacterium SCSIO 66511]|nr:GntR family transcriptional regulator [Nocardioidaceae bacterium SCSIO 66511]